MIPENKHYTIPHQIISEYLKQNNIQFIENTRSIIKPDIFIPDKKLAIEINGIYWHTELQDKDSKYHLNKLNRCEELGIKLLQFTDSDILDKTDLVLSMIGNSLGINQLKIGARKCFFGKVATKVVKQFFHSNHIQGSGTGSVNFGLFKEGELLSCISLVNHDIQKVMITK